jgi:hypothetical protein
LIKRLGNKESQVEAKIEALELKKQAHYLRGKKIDIKIGKIEEKITE